MSLADLHLTEAIAPDYQSEARCLAYGCMHRATVDRFEGETLVQRTEFTCARFYAKGEPAALWVRTNEDGICPHFRGIA